MEELTLLVLPQRCLQITDQLEIRLSDPKDATISMDACRSCLYCADSNEFPPVDRTGVVLVLFNIFLTGDRKLQGLTTVDKVVKAMVAYPGIARHLFRSARLSDEPPVDIKKVLLSLIADRILLVVQYYNNGDSSPGIILTPAVSSPGATTFASDDDSFWRCINKTKEFE
jgi:hypothetical protein